MESTRGVKRNKYVVFDGTKQANINQHLNYFSSLFSNFPVQFLVFPPLKISGMILRECTVGEVFMVMKIHVLCYSTWISFRWDMLHPSSRQKTKASGYCKTLVF